MEDEELLRGGLNSVRRIGSTVIRPSGNHSSSVHRLLQHIESKGFAHAPTPLGLDSAAGTETLTFMPGHVGHYPLPADFRTGHTLVLAARLLREYHDATTDFAATDTDIWFLPSHEPAEVICHGDFAPYNCALDDGVLNMFDFDTAHPGSRLADLGYAAYRWVPLTDPTNPDGFGTIDEQRQRFRRFCETYGESGRLAVLDAAIGRVGELVDLMRRLAGDGHPAFAGHVADGHDTLYLADIEHMRDHSSQLIR